MFGKLGCRLWFRVEHYETHYSSIGVSGGILFACHGTIHQTNWVRACRVTITSLALKGYDQRLG